MTNYIIRFGRLYNGKERPKIIVQAETAEQAKQYIEWIDTRCEVRLPIETTDEIADYYCPAGWAIPETKEQAKFRSYYKWLRNYVGKFMNPEIDGEFEDIDGLCEFLESEGWERKESKIDERFDDIEVEYTNKRNGKTITFTI